MAEPEHDELRAWVEEVATFFAEQYGQPPIAGRILGWLMVCDPPEQSATQIAGAIGASRASLTTNLNLLTAAGLVRRRTGPGARTTYFRVDDDAWPVVVRRRIATLASFADVAERGMDLFGADSARAGRLRAARETFLWMARAFERSDDRDF
ncbi:GbsR/MarR family transcriptional regulator [Amycolatopsis thermoflava]|uniref:GbsR/MarR family transcriptional regulator n=1 Tax=Amycolatopsis thermoflava TaxID=84480 RepID=UPI0004109F3B|nr:MarR family transcriptional regulator [Amycolatopsis thermoflava]